MVRRRQLLPRPEEAPPAVYQLMLDCWHQTPGRRPRFPAVLARLRGWLLAGPGQGCAQGAGGAGSSLSLRPEQGGSLPRTSASLPRPPAARSTQLVLGRASSSASSLAGSQIDRL